MRQIKFRGRHRGKWYYGVVAVRNMDAEVPILIMQNDNLWLPLDIEENCTVGQFTGLLDIHGKEIFEGDIVQRVYRMEEGRGKNKHEVLRPVGNCKPKVISFRMGSFGYVNFKEREYVEEEWLPILDEECEVLGNIFDNPEIECGGD